MYVECISLSLSIRGSTLAAGEPARCNGCGTLGGWNLNVTALKFQSLNIVKLARKTIISMSENGYCFSLLKGKQPTLTDFGKQPTLTDFDFFLAFFHR